MKKLIICDDIVKSFGEGDDQRRVLDGVSAYIHEGEFVSVMGPSGSGKSTFMFALSGTDGVNGGTVFLTARIYRQPRRMSFQIYGGPIWGLSSSSQRC